jgi:hypothetical protein
MSEHLNRRAFLRQLSLAFALATARSTAVGAPEPSPATPRRRQGPLAGLPSKPGPLFEKIKALGDNEWLEVGAPAADPKWGKGRGRSWSSRMAYAPDLQGAFLIGQGVHGFIKPDGYFMDDIWFYDLAAHRWICIYPGTDTRNFVENVKRGELKVNDDGQLVDKMGRLVSFSTVAGHSYQDHAYDPDRGQYIFGGHGDGIGSEQHVRDQEWCKKGRELLLAQGKTDKASGAPYGFNTVTGMFERPPAGAGGRAHGGAGGSFMVDLCYLPTKKTFWQHSRGTVWLADPATHAWKYTKVGGPAPEGNDVGICYDSKRDRIYVCGGPSRGREGAETGAVFIYDVKANVWSRPQNKGKPPAPGLFSANRSCVQYDAVNDRMIVLVFGGERDAQGVHAYDPETASWRDAPLAPPPTFSADRSCGHGFYSPELNAHFFYRAHDSDDRGTMWVYRYKQASK